MKINLTKLTKLQEEFKEGNLLQNITAWDILEIIDEESSTISLHSLIKAMEEGDIYLEEDILKEYGIDKLTREEDSILRDCDEKLHIKTQYHKTSLYGGSIMLLIVKYEDTIVKIFSYNNHEFSEEELYEEDLDKITEITIITYTCKDGYATKIE